MRRSKMKQRASFERSGSSRSLLLSPLKSNSSHNKRSTSITSQDPNNSNNHNGGVRSFSSGATVTMLWVMFMLGYTIHFLNDASMSTVDFVRHLRSQMNLDLVENDDDSVRPRRTVVIEAEEDEGFKYHQPQPSTAKSKKKKDAEIPIAHHETFPDVDPSRQRIVILAGPHKAASTMLQSFLYEVAGRTTWILPKNEPKDGKKRPHPAFHSWAWPVGVRREFGRNPATSLSGGGITEMPPSKFHAPLASLVTGKAQRNFLPRLEDEGATPEEKKEYLDSVSSYYRQLFAVPWKEGKNLVIGSEELTSMAMALSGEAPRLHPPDDEWAPVTNDLVGEARHIDPHSEAMIDRLLAILPWNTTVPGSSSTLELRDIEIHINYRTPRIDHAVSVWHQIHNGTTLREFFATNAKELYVINSLSLALQFVRKGLRTTIVDMNGGKTYGKTVDMEPAVTGDDGMTLLGGQEGIVACDILRIGSEKETAFLPADKGGPGPRRGFCDERSRLHLTGYKQSAVDRNAKEDPQPRDLSHEEFLRMDDLLRQYDCGVWRQIDHYRGKGLLRVLYPSAGLFNECGDDSRDKDMGYSFAAVLREFRRMALSKRVENTNQQ